jgi:hypothetical protein
MVFKYGDIFHELNMGCIAFLPFCGLLTQTQRADVVAAKSS